MALDGCDTPCLPGSCPASTEDLTQTVLFVQQEEDHGMAQDDGDENDDIFAPKAGSKTAGKVKGHKAGKAKGQEAEEEDEEAPALGPDGERVLGVSKKGSDARRKELLAAGGVDSLAAGVF